MPDLYIRNGARSDQRNKQVAKLGLGLLLSSLLDPVFLSLFLKIN